MTVQNGRRWPVARSRAFVAGVCFVALASCGEAPRTLTNADPRATTTSTVATVKLTPTLPTIAVGSTVTFTVTGYDASGNVVPGSITCGWASDYPAVATVSAGVAKGISPGKSLIKAGCGGILGMTTVTVVAAPPSVASVTVTPASGSVTVGRTLQLTATARDSAGNVLAGRSVTWTTDAPQNALVDSCGLVSTQAVGSANIKATIDGRNAVAPITVTPVLAASVTLTPASASVTVGRSLQLAATARDSAGNALNRPIAWTSSAPGVATVDTTGLVATLATGSATITASADGRSASAAITVTPVLAASVTVAPTSATLAIGATQQLTATARDSSGNVLSRPTTWTSSAPAVASVSASGLVTGVAAGSASITATVDGRTATAAITVPAPPPATAASVTLTPTSASLVVGGTQQLTATAKDAAGNVLTGRTFTWTSSAPAVAGVSASGLVTGAAAGSATITVTVDGKSATAAITVSAPTAPGGLHEPAGMTTFVNDNGSVRVPAGMTATAPWTGANGWGDLHTALVSDPTNPTGSGMAIEKRWLAGDSTDAAARPGLLTLDHWSTVNSAFKPVKTVYVRLRVWLDPSWPGIDPYNLGGFKFFYLKTSASANYVIWTSKEPSGTVQWASLLNGSVLARVGNVTPGQWHTVEYLFQMSSAPGASDGSANVWLDGKLLSSMTSIMWVDAGSTKWTCNFDGMEFYPLRGMVGHTFPQANRMRLGELYVSGQ